jgi:hypothetical protein
MLVLTSRGYDMRDVTRREFAANGYNFRANEIALGGNLDGPFLPYQANDLKSAGVSMNEGGRFLRNGASGIHVNSRPKAPEVETMAAQPNAARSVGNNRVPTLANKPIAKEIKPPALVSYSEGVFMTAGQHKGMMLRILLHRSQREFDAIVFVDDRDQHIKAVQDAFADHAIREVWTFRYCKEDANVSRFNPPDTATAERVTEQWKSLASALRSLNWAWSSR